MLILDSNQSSTVMSIPAKETQVNSHVSPWLASLVYPLGRYCVLPFYFKSLELAPSGSPPAIDPAPSQAPGKDNKP